MYLLVHQNHDLCELSGYAFSSLQAALNSAAKSIGNGLSFQAAAAAVRMEEGPAFPCHAVLPVGGQIGDSFAREGQMTLIVPVCDAASVAVRLCRRNGEHGTGRVEIL